MAFPPGVEGSLGPLFRGNLGNGQLEIHLGASQATLDAAEEEASNA